MIQLSRAAIRKIASNDMVYSRGLRYYNNKTILNLTWSNSTKQYRAVIKGNTNYIVIIEIPDGEELKYHCNCPAAFKDTGACKHVVAALLGIADYTDQKEAAPLEQGQDKKIFQILEYFKRQEELSVIGETFHIDVTISLTQLLKHDNGRAMISIQAGGNRNYKVTNIKKFLSDYHNNQDIILGKEFKFIANESKFDKASFRILEYLLEIYEIQEALGKVYYSNMFVKGQIPFTQGMLFRLLHLLGDKRIALELNETCIEHVKFVQSRPNLKYDLEINDDIISMDYNGREQLIPLTEDGRLLYSNRVIYEPDQQFIKNYLPFYKLLDPSKEALKFEGENKLKFLEYVLPELVNTMNFEIPEKIQAKYIAEQLITKVYLDRYKNAIRAEILFNYGDYEFNPNDRFHRDGMILLRQRKKELDFIEYMESFGFVPYKTTYLLKGEEEIYVFLTKYIKELTDKTELYYSNEFKKLQIYQSNSLNSKIRLNTGLDLLELSFELEQIPKEELAAVLQSLVRKKKFHRLKGGSFIDLDQEDLLKASELMQMIGINTKNIKDSMIQMPVQQAAYLSNLASSQKIIRFDEEQEFLDFVDRIKNPAVMKHNIPKSIRAQLRPYQIIGFQWLVNLAENGMGGILADDMGLGKTLQAIVYMTYYMELNYIQNNNIPNSNISDIKKSSLQSKFLVICPSSLTYNWQDEIETFSPKLKSIVVSGNPQDRKDILTRYKEVDVLITSYPLLRRDIELYLNLNFHSVFIDEAQYIKNSSSLNAKSVKLIPTKHKFALTGTPIENSLAELWSIFDFIMPHYLFSFKKFTTTYEKKIIKSDDRNALLDLNMKIRPFILRRMKKDVLTELPDKIETKMIADMTDEQRLVYGAYLQQIRSELGSYDKKNDGENKIKILAALTRLRQICAHPSSFLQNYKGGSGKYDLLMEILTNALESDHRILIFSQFTSMLAIILKELKKRNVPFFYLEGSTPAEKRLDYSKRFNSGEGKIFLVSLKAGGTGLNLIGADMVIHYDPWWNPAVEAQATDRAYRIGQKNTVTVIRLITKGTIEEKIYKLQKKKRQLSESVIEPREVFLNNLSKEELEQLFDIEV